MDRPSAKWSIDKAANMAKGMVIDNDLMPVYLHRRVMSMFCERVNQTAKCRKFFLKHTHHTHDVLAAVHIWNHPEDLQFDSLELLEDNKDLSDWEDLSNFIKKLERGVIEFVRYRLSYENRVFVVKTELLKSYYEQFYAIYEERK